VFYRTTVDGTGHCLPKTNPLSHQRRDQRDLHMITLNFDGIDDYIEIAGDARLSVATTGRLTIAAWMRPDVLAFPNF